VDYSGKLSIGTAQWGLDYGVTNTSGRLPDSAISDLLHTMRNHAITHLDTAASYGDSEKRIGHLDTTGMQIQTKLAAQNTTMDLLVTALHQSLDRLRTSKVDSLLIHDWFALNSIEMQEVSDFFELAIDNGLTNHVGISAYSLPDLEHAQAKLAVWDIAQIPINALDQRFAGAASSFPHIAFQARSIFLQGLLLSGSSTHPDVVAFHQRAAETDTDPLTLSLGYIKSQPWLDTVIIAPTNETEFDQILSSLRCDISEVEFEHFKSTDLQLLDPRTWG
jgi:aryl-alcohol dehydrogenase-like predicted oxidoreductase